MANALESIQGIGVVAVLGAGLYLAWRYFLKPMEGEITVPNPVGGIISATDKILGDPGVYCDTLGHNIYPSQGMTCPTEAEWTPTKTAAHLTEPETCYQNGQVWCEKQQHCVFPYLASESYCDPAWSPVQENLETPPLAFKSDLCTAKNGGVVSVPPGMDCTQALQDMCDRWASYGHPDSKFCGGMA